MSTHRAVTSSHPLHALQNRLLELAITHLLAGIVGRGLAVKSKEGTEVELGGLEELDFADVDLVKCQLGILYEPSQWMSLTFWRG